MRTLTFLTILLLSASLGATSALAQAGVDDKGLHQCGTPIDNELTTDGVEHGFCDIYARRFAYQEKRTDLRKRIEERRENFATHRRAAIERYEADLENHHNSISGDTH